MEEAKGSPTEPPKPSKNGKNSKNRKLQGKIRISCFSRGIKGGKRKRLGLIVKVWQGCYYWNLLVLMVVLVENSIFALFQPMCDQPTKGQTNRVIDGPTDCLKFLIVVVKKTRQRPWREPEETKSSRIQWESVHLSVHPSIRLYVPPRCPSEASSGYSEGIPSL